MSPSEFLRLAVDPVRLAVLGHAVAGPVDTEHVARVLDVRVRSVRDAVGRLRAAGLLDAENRLDRDVLRDLASSLPQTPPADSHIVGGTWSSEEAEVLSRFFTGGRLSSIPTQQSKRRVVLERLAQEFEPGLRYQEAEVNFTLQMFHADYAALRRYLVDEGLMTRAEGVYWRTGGRYEGAGDGEGV